MEHRVTLYFEYLLSTYIAEGHQTNAHIGLHSLLITGIMRAGCTVDINEAGGQFVVIAFWAAYKWQH